VEGLLLAAGAGRRMGMPKALVSDDHGPWLPRAVDTLLAGGCAHVTVVLGASADEARALLPDDDRVGHVVADDWDEGMGASLRRGLSAIASSDAFGAVVSLVDLPDLVPAVVTRLIDAGAAAQTLARASYDGVPGHPVVLGRAHWAPAAAIARGDRGARDYLAGRDVTLVECGDLATGRDVDSLG
jgi:CTP:molybdopterin cytidylyltransferase MocA